MRSVTQRWLMVAALVAGLSALTGCATASNPRDPLESINRPIHKFNDTLDTYAFRPVAVGYRRFVPEPVRQAFGNFVSNLGDIYVGLNNLLQAKPREALSDLSRFVVNSTLGIGGIADVASELGLEKNNEDFGQTLGYWGVPAGPYVVLPFLGPSSFRDAPARVVDAYGNPIGWYDRVDVRNSVIGLSYVEDRAQLLDADRLLRDALDPYSLMRDGYLQRRRNLVYDGEPPDEDDNGDTDADKDFYADDPSKDEPKAGGAAPAGAKPN